MLTPPNILTIAGSDSGGGAGIQADLKTIMALGGYGMSVITALTAQNGCGVTGIHAPDPDFVLLQLQTVLEGFPVAAAKTGMLFSAPIIRALGTALRKRSFPLVVDPVSVSQSGSPLLQEDAVAALVEEMLPGCDLLTPNRPEAEMLTGLQIRNLDDAARAGEKLLNMGPRAVLIKGGHMDSSVLVTDCSACPVSPPNTCLRPRWKPAITTARAAPFRRPSPQVWARGCPCRRPWPARRTFSIWLCAKATLRARAAGRSITRPGSARPDSPEHIAGIY